MYSTFFVSASWKNGGIYASFFLFSIHAFFVPLHSEIISCKKHFTLLKIIRSAEGADVKQNK